MTTAEICALSQASLDQVRALKKEFDTAFKILTISGGRDELRKVEALQRQIEAELRSPFIARSPEQISGKALIYVGKLEPGMFKNFPRSIEHVYTSFPENELQLESLQIGGQTSAGLQELMRESGVRISDDTKDLMDNPAFGAPERPERIDLIRLRIGDLGLSGHITTDQVYARIAELGLELCPPSVAPHYRLANLDQPIHDWVFVGMKPISDQRGDPHVFRVGHNIRGLWLIGLWAKPDTQWVSDYQFLFRVRRDE